MSDWKQRSKSPSFLGFKDPVEVLPKSLLFQRLKKLSDSLTPSLQNMSWVVVVVLVPKSCLTLCDPMDCCLPGSYVQGIIQARILECVAISFSRGSSRPRVWTLVSCIAGRFFSTEPPGKPPQSMSCASSILHVVSKEVFKVSVTTLPLQQLRSQREVWDLALGKVKSSQHTAFGHGYFHMPRIWRSQLRARRGGFTQFPKTLEHQHQHYFFPFSLGFFFHLFLLVGG